MGRHRWLIVGVLGVAVTLLAAAAGRWGACAVDGRWVIRLRARPASGIPDAAFPVEVGR